MTPDDANGRQIDVAASLQEMDRKLRELQRELAAAAAPHAAPVPAPPPDAEPPAQPPLWWLQKQQQEQLAGPDPAELGDQVQRLLELRDRLVEKIRGVMEEAERGLRELGIETGAAQQFVQAAPMGPPPQDPAGQVLEGKVVVEAGPFADIGILTQFERVLAGVPGVADVYVRGFEGDRALIDVTLTEQVRLGAELVARLGAGARPLEASSERLVIAMEGG